LALLEEIFLLVFGSFRFSANTPENKARKTKNIPTFPVEGLTSLTAIEESAMPIHEMFIVRGTYFETATTIGRGPKESEYRKDVQL